MTTERLALYDIDSVSATVMNIPITDGRGQEVFLEITPPEQFEYIEGNGLVVACATRKRLYPVKLTLVSSSRHTAQLSALHAMDYLSVGGAGVGAFLVKDAGSTSLTGDSCRIVQAPARTFGRLIKEETWLLMVTSSPSKMLFGGHEIV